MSLVEYIIDYMSHVQGVSQRLQGIYMDKIISLFATSRLYHDHYPGIESRFLAWEQAIITCGLLDIVGLLYSDETQQQSLG